MKLYYQDKEITLYEGKMQDVLKTLPDNSIDSCICDPPYDLTALSKRWSKETKLGVSEGTQYGRLAKGFMGKTWDATGVAFEIETWQEVLRVLKPGGYLLAFGGTRTYHRMAVAIEDAGFEIRDCIMWLYGVGFPKSMNIGKQLEKRLEDEKAKQKTEQCRAQESREVIEYWNKFGTALKPAYEPIIMARKPIEDTVAKNCLKYGVGGINIDECRIYGETISCHDTEKGTFAGKVQTTQDFSKSKERKLPFGQNENPLPRIEYVQHEGRFPANVITDGSEEVAAGMPETKSEYNINNKHSEKLTIDKDIWNFGYSKRIDSGFNDSGSAMRYFYQAKASKKDRDEGLDAFEEKYYLREDTPQEIIEEIRRLLSDE